MSTRTRKTALAAYVAMICGLLASCGPNDNRPDLLAAYKNQTLEWQTCSENQTFRAALGESNIELLGNLGDRARCAFLLHLARHLVCRANDCCEIRMVNLVVLSARHHEGPFMLPWSPVRRHRLPRLFSRSRLRSGIF